MKRAYNSTPSIHVLRLYSTILNRAVDQSTLAARHEHGMSAFWDTLPATLFSFPQHLLLLRKGDQESLFTLTRKIFNLLFCVVVLECYWLIGK